MAEVGVAKAKKPKKETVTPSLETNKRIMKECAKVTVDLKKVMALFNCRRDNAVALAAAAEHNMVPGGVAKA